MCLGRRGGGVMCHRGGGSCALGEGGLIVITFKIYCSFYLLSYNFMHYSMR